MASFSSINSHLQDIDWEQKEAFLYNHQKNRKKQHNHFVDYTDNNDRNQKRNCGSWDTSSYIFCGSWKLKTTKDPGDEGSTAAAIAQETSKNKSSLVFFTESINNPVTYDGPDWITPNIFQSKSALLSRNIVASAAKKLPLFNLTMTHSYATTLSKSNQHSRYPAMGKKMNDGHKFFIHDLEMRTTAQLTTTQLLTASNLDINLVPIRIHFLTPSVVTSQGQIFSLNAFDCTTSQSKMEYAVFRSGGCLGSATQQMGHHLMCNSNGNLVPLAITVSCRWGAEIWHFPMESLPGLADHDEWLMENPQAKVHITKKTDFALMWLELVGIEADRVIDGTQYIDELYTTRLGRCGGPYPYQIAWLQKHIHRQGIFPDIRKRRTILVVNRSPSSRAIVNEKEVESAMRTLARQWSLDFKVFNSAKLGTVKDQLQQFAQATLIVTPHGATEINSVACSPGTVVLEIVEKTYVNTCGMELQYLSHLRYYGIQSTRYHVNLQHLQSIVEFALQRGEVKEAKFDPNTGSKVTATADTVNDLDRTDTVAVRDYDDGDDDETAILKQAVVEILASVNNPLKPFGDLADNNDFHNVKPALLDNDHDKEKTSGENLKQISETASAEETSDESLEQVNEVTNAEENVVAAMEVTKTQDDVVKTIAMVVDAAKQQQDKQTAVKVAEAVIAAQKAQSAAEEAFEVAGRSILKPSKGMKQAKKLAKDPTKAIKNMKMTKGLLKEKKGKKKKKKKKKKKDLP